MMNLAEFFSVFPAQLATVLIATLPLVELQGAIPLAVTVYKMPILEAYVWSWLGSIIPAIFILWLLGPVSGFLMQRFSIMNRFFVWLFAKTRRQFSGKYAVWGTLALTLFAAVPLPGAGVWSGSVAAFLFGIPKKFAFLFISLGSAIAGVIVSMVTLGIVSAL